MHRRDLLGATGALAAAAMSAPALAQSADERRLEEVREQLSVDRLHAAASQHGRVQKRIARTVGKLDEPEALLRFEPFYNGIDDRPGGLVETRSAEPRSHPKIARRRLEFLVVKAAAAPLPKISVLFQLSILISHPARYDHATILPRG